MLPLVVAESDQSAIANNKSGVSKPAIFVVPTTLDSWRIFSFVWLEFVGTSQGLWGRI